jgi:hypothetical protein
MNACAEASERLEGRYETRVREPSPLAVTGGPWFAEDPVARGEAPGGLEELRAGEGNRLDSSRVQLWPEHFDLAVDLGPETRGSTRRKPRTNSSPRSAPGNKTANSGTR